jgi:hypothetical protein
MNAQTPLARFVGPADVLLRIAIVSLTLATAAIHASLGGYLFLANAAGYLVLATGMLLPGPFSRGRWLVRLALIGFTVATIGAWVLFGARFQLAYLDKAIEVALVALLLVEMWRADGGPLGVARRGWRWLTDIAGAIASRA